MTPYICRRFFVWIYNNGAREETGTMEVGITTAETVSALPPPTPPPPPPTGGNPTSNLAPGPVARYTIKVRSIDAAGGGGQSFWVTQEGIRSNIVSLSLGN